MKLVKVCEDKRGYTHTIEDDNLGVPEITMFYTKKGYARGGCVHKHPEVFCVVSGDVTLVCGELVVRMDSGMTHDIPKGSPHYYISKTDSVVLEWGTIGEDKQTKHETYRNIVNQINDTADRT